jgi:large subunit ribosomal protein L9
LRQLDALKQKRAEREARELNEAEELARRIGKARFIFTLETGETGKAFGSVTAQDIMNRIKNELGVEIDRHKIVVERPIKDTGEHEVAIKLHHDVTAQLVFQVKSAEGPRDRGAEADSAATDEPEKRKKPGFFRRKPNKWRLNRPHGQERSLVKREMALAEVRRHEAAKRLFPFRQQVLRRIFTVPRRIASKQNKAFWGQCCSRRGKPLPNVSRRLMSNIFTSPPIRRSIVSSSIFGMPVRRST